MYLYEAIEKIVKNEGRALKVEEIASIINSEGHYLKEDNTKVMVSDILPHINNYPSILKNINGYIIHSDNILWKLFIDSVLYLQERIRGVFSVLEIQFIISGLLLIKRILDVNSNKINEPNFSYSYDIRHFVEINRYRKEFDNIPESIFSNLGSLLLGLNSSIANDVFNIINRLDTKLFDDNEFGSIFEFLLIQNGELFKSEYCTPENIKSLIFELFKSQYDKGVVYDPVAGFGGLLNKVIQFDKDITIKGTEVYNRVAQLGNMSLLMYGQNNPRTIETKNCFDEFSETNKYEFILGDLPINGILNSQAYSELYYSYGLDAPKSGKGFNSLVLFCYSKLSSGGKAVLTVSDSFLTKGGVSKEVRRILIRDDAIEAIISLPKGVYRPFNEAKSSILVLNKNKSANLNGKIRFIRAEAIGDSKKNFELNIEAVVSAYKLDHNNRTAQTIAINQIKDFNLTLDVYDFLSRQIIAEKAGQTLKALVVVQTGSQPSKDDLVLSSGIPVVKIENLSKDILDIHLDIDLIKSKVSDNDKYKNAIIDKECILIAKIGDNLKPTIFRPRNGEKILVHSGVFALLPKETTDLEYLYYQLYSDFVVEQLNFKRKGALISYFNKREIEEAVIPYDFDIKQQKKAVAAEKAKLIASESKKLEERKRTLGYVEESREAELNIVRTITHQLKHRLTTIDVLIEKIGAIMQKNNLGQYKEYDENFDDDDGEFEPRENEIMEQIVEKVLNKSNLLNKILTDVEKAIHLEMVFTTENLYLLLSNLKNEYLDISIEIKGASDIELLISKTHFEDLFYTLLDNAIQHSNLKREKIKILFNLKKEDGSVKMEFRNNGQPIRITSQDFKSIATKSQESTGNGVGGYYINKIVEAHGGILTVIEQLRTGVHIIVELPIKEIENG